MEGKERRIVISTVLGDPISQGIKGDRRKEETIEALVKRY